jgi:hypothetical protein
MAKKKKKDLMTDEQVAYIVSSEGLGYAITGYMGSEKFENRELAELWNQANDILNKIQNILDEAWVEGEDSHDI